MRIKTHYDPPPMPYRDHDWCAYDDDTYDGSPGQPIGWGETEQDAIDDLKDQLDCDKCGGAGQTYHPHNKFDDTVQTCKSCFGTGRMTW